MAYATLSHWTASEWSEDLEHAARQTFVPMILAIGAESVEMIRTGNYSFTVVTRYPDEDTAEAAEHKIATLRSRAASELPITIDAAAAGRVFAAGAGSPQKTNRPAWMRETA